MLLEGSGVSISISPSSRAASLAARSFCVSSVSSTCMPAFNWASANLQHAQSLSCMGPPLLLWHLMT